MKQEYITCKECKWSEERFDDTFYCECPKFVDVSEETAGDIDIDGFAVYDAEEYGAGFYVGANFGCIHGVKI